MAVKITYFVHGTTTDNEKDLATGWLPGELSNLGKEQMIRLGQQLRDKSFEVVFCSDLQRAVESAKLAFGDRHTIIPDKRLRECNYGDMNGAPAMDFKERLEDFITVPFAHGESYTEVEKRLQSFTKYLQENYGGKHIAVVAHQGPQLALDVLLKGKTWRRAITEDWRKTKQWQPGWEYLIP
jgi:broad specificity phosphatase PhoE